MLMTESLQDFHPEVSKIMALLYGKRSNVIVNINVLFGILSEKHTTHLAIAMRHSKSLTWCS